MADVDRYRERLGRWMRERGFGVKFAWDCRPCKSCGEPFCDECGDHYADCKHPGPHSDECFNQQVVRY